MPSLETATSAAASSPTATSAAATSENATSAAPASAVRRWLGAAGALAAVALVWLVVLPWLGQQKPIREHVEALHAADINASAMFYSELECSYMLRR